jgi:hypothetical protein
VRAGDDQAARLELFRRRLPERPARRQLGHHGPDDLGVGAVVLLLGIPDLDDLEPPVGGPADVEERPSTEPVTRRTAATP